MTFKRSSRCRVAIVSASMLITVSVYTGCSGPPDALASNAASASSAQSSAAATFKPADDAAVDARARETEGKMTDDERFTLLISLIGAVPSIGVPRDKRIPESVTNMSAGTRQESRG